MSLSDLQSAAARAAAQLQLHISEHEESARELGFGRTGSLGAGDGVPRGAWVQAMIGADTEDIFEARGVIVGMSEAEASSPVKQVAVPAKMPSKESVQSLIDNASALLVFNCFSP